MKKFIDFIVVGIVTITCGALGGSIMYDSYQKYQEYYKENFPEIDPTDNAKLLSIRAEFAPGVYYYDNNKAKPIREDFVVTGLWKPNKEGQEQFEHVLKPEKRPYTVTVDDHFSRLGGTITIEYQGLTTNLQADLVPVKLDKLEITQSPYVTKYAVGEYFDKTGVKANAVYNDGSIKELDDTSIFVPEALPLKTSDKLVYVAYSEDSLTKTAKVDISVSKTLNDGEVVAIGPSSTKGKINNGSRLDSATFDVLATYKSGNKKLLSVYDYSIINGDQTANLGLEHFVEVSYKQNPNLKGKIPLIVNHKIEGENGYVIGGHRKDETEYIIDKSGNAIKVGDVAFAGDFGKFVTEGKEAYILFETVSHAANLTDFTIRVANSNVFKIDNNYWMKPLQINTIADLYLNDKKIDIPNNVILSGCGPHKDYEPLYNVYSNVTFKDLPLSVGRNRVKLQFKSSTIGELNHFEETPSTMNFDYVTFSTSGVPMDENIKFNDIYFDTSFRLRYGDNFDNMYIPIYGIYGSDNRKIILTDKFAKITKPTGYATIGSHTIKAELYNGGKTVSKTFVIGDVILEAENAVISGNENVVSHAENEYLYDEVSKRYYKGDVITVVKGMDHSATNHLLGETSLKFQTVGAPGGNRLIIKCSNTNFFVDSNNKGYTKPMNLEDAIDIYVNGQKHSFSVAMPTISDAGHDDWCWMGMFELDCGVIELNGGVKNEIKIVAKRGSGVPKNKWNEYAIPRFDYIKLTNQ